jgi:hypothetical protein
MLFRNKKWEYLCEDNNLDEREEAIMIVEEIVNSKISRFKIDDKYIGCVLGKAFMTDKEDDSTLFIYEKNENRYMTVGGMYLTLIDHSLQCCEENEDLILERLNENDKLFYKFKSDGMIVWQGDFALDFDLVDEARNKIASQKHTRIRDLLCDDKIFPLFLKNDRMKYLLDKIYNEKYHLTTYSSNTLRKEDRDERSFHVDYPYHTIESPYPDKILGVQVIYALDDFTVENGATMYIPQSYKTHRFPDNKIFYNKRNLIKYITVPKGSIILYRCDTWHSQGINITDEPRVAILANFSPLHISAKDDVVSQVLRATSDLKIIDGKVIL